MTNPYLQIAELIGKIKDPDREKRELLLKVIQTDPSAAARLKAQYGDSLEKLLGQRPKFGLLGKGKEEYENLSSLISGAQDSPEMLADKFKSNELKNLLGLQSLYSTDVADASKRVDMSNVNQSMINNFGNVVQRQTYDEARASAPSGRIDIQTPTQRKAQQLQMDATQASIDSSRANQEAAKARQTGDEFDLEEKKRLKAQQEASDLIAKRVFSRHGTGPGLLDGMRSGKVSPEEMTAIINYKNGSGSKMLDDIRDDWYKQELLKIDRDRSSSKYNLEQALQQADIRFATNLSEKLGGGITPTDAYNLYVQIRSNPELRKQLSNTDEEAVKSVPQMHLLWRVNDTITNFKKKIEPKEIAKLRVDFQTKAAPLLKSIRERTVDDAQIDGIIADINSISEGIFLPYNLEPIKYGIKKASSGLTDINNNNLKVPVIISADPLFNEKIDNKSLTSAEKASIFEALGKKYPNETDEQIKARVEKGERP